MSHFYNLVARSGSPTGKEDIINLDPHLTGSENLKSNNNCTEYLQFFLLAKTTVLSFANLDNSDLVNEESKQMSLTK